MRLILAENVDVTGDPDDTNLKTMFLVGDDGIDPSTWLRDNARYTYKLISVMNVVYSGSFDSLIGFGNLPFEYVSG